jgi:uncharacterized membrane protein YccF (DUF307 family)
VSESPSLLVRAAWFIFVGSWLTGVALTAAWMLNLTIIGLPAGIKIINRVPYLLTLKQSESSETGRSADNLGDGSETPSFAVRGAYFIFVGWWASGLLMGVAYLSSLTVIGIPIGVVLFNYLPYVTSLKQ